MRPIILLAVLLMSVTQINAQQTTGTSPAPAPAVAQDATKVEIRDMSGKLKETLGQVSQHLMSVEKQLSVPTPEAKGTLEQSKTDLMTAKAELEASLTAVNRATVATWTDVKAKAQGVNDRALALLKVKK